ncbi:putative ribosomal-protein-alanine acetyltransferase RimJ [Williamsia phyllosphaerae]|uniref:Ribosomal-protein-alanine acetyltransferase RimJ n=1 Tax=Williamsia phyllosphaerae TaxID=885042 RepID=A0ABQ1V3C3_9NOCA|nr:GNAT family protein [Williamsia phyllosphaerae]GGF33845.1 putative ribosomal-protein-alanine acetyltransferase RimJ [Williamsia phyllosphaerae]
MRSGAGHPGWPTVLGPLQTRAGTVTLRGVRLRDARAWSSLRIANQNTLMPWEPTGQGNWVDRHHMTSWPTLHSVLKREAKNGSMLPLVIEVDGEFVGQLTIGNIQRGALRNAWIGYWIDNSVTNQGVATAAVALGVDHCFGAVGLHRLEATVQPGNEASKAVLTKVGFRKEGLLERYMDVDRGWRDHILFALTAEEIAGSAAEALVRSGRASYPG